MLTDPAGFAITQPEQAVVTGNYSARPQLRFHLPPLLFEVGQYLAGS
jgi:hypothetical protein